MKPTGLALWGFLLLFWTNSLRAQTLWPSPELKQIFEKAQAHQSRGELDAAIQIYRQALSLAPHMSLLYRELGQALYYAGDYSGVQETLRPLVQSGEADATSHQVLGAAYRAQSQWRKARGVLGKGIERYPHSGLLYHELGQTHLDNHRPRRAAEAWREGLRQDPDFHLNYYALARYYMGEKNYLMAAIHAEIFVNLEQKTQRSQQARRLIMDAYRGHFLTDPDRAPFTPPRQPQDWSFETAVSSIHQGLIPLALNGISTETLTMIRTRFIMEWERQFAQQYPFTLFSRHQQMIRNGYFDAYNQWLFGEVENAEQYQAWNRFHEKAVPELEAWLKANPYLPLGTDFPASP